MVEQTELFGTIAREYDSIEEFVDGIEGSGAKRLHTFFNQGFLGMGGSWTASCVGATGMVHGYNTSEIEEGFKDRVKPIYDLIKAEGIREVDGIIRVSPRNGSIYQVFQTENPENPQKAKSSFEAWVDAILGFPTEGAVAQYLRDESRCIIDVTRGKYHWITALDGKKDRTLDRVVTWMPYKCRDNTDTVIWYLDMKSK